MVYRSLSSLIGLALLTLGASAQGAPTAQRITAAGDGRVMIQGQGFGAACPRCKVIADFGGFKSGLSLGVV